MKRIGVVLVVLLVVAAVVAAAQGAGTSKAAPLKITYVTGMKGLPFYISLNCGVRAEAKKLGLDYTFTGPQDFDATQQIPILNAAIAQHPDGLIVSPTDQTALITPLKAAESQGIKVAQVDVTVSDKSVGVSRVLSDNYAGGALAVKALAKLTKGKKGSVFIVGVKPGISSTDQRDIGFAREIKKYPQFKFLGVQYNQGTERQAQAVVTAMIAKHKDLIGIFGAGNVGSEGTAAALRAAKVQGRVKLVQYDASPAQVTELKQHVLDALIAQDPYQEGVDAVDQVVNAINGKPVQKLVMTKLHIITRDTLATTKKFAYQTAC